MASLENLVSPIFMKTELWAQSGGWIIILLSKTKMNGNTALPWNHEEISIPRNSEPSKNLGVKLVSPKTRETVSYQLKLFLNQLIQLQTPGIVSDLLISNLVVVSLDLF